jgi:hypothetical protein
VRDTVDTCSPAFVISEPGGHRGALPPLSLSLSLSLPSFKTLGLRSQRAFVRCTPISSFFLWVSGSPRISSRQSNLNQLALKSAPFAAAHSNGPNSPSPSPSLELALSLTLTSSDTHQEPVNAPSSPFFYSASCIFNVEQRPRGRTISFLLPIFPPRLHERFDFGYVPSTGPYPIFRVYCHWLSDSLLILTSGFTY